MFDSGFLGQRGFRGKEGEVAVHAVRNRAVRPNGDHGSRRRSQFVVFFGPSEPRYGNMHDGLPGIETWVGILPNASRS